jgi:hypothetical protein
LAFHSGREADHSPPSSAEVKEYVELYLHSPNMPSWRGAQLGGAQGLYLLPASLLMLSKTLAIRQPYVQNYCKHLCNPGVVRTTVS